MIVPAPSAEMLKEGYPTRWDIIPFFSIYIMNLLLLLLLFVILINITANFKEGQVPRRRPTPFIQPWLYDERPKRHWGGMTEKCGKCIKCDRECLSYCAKHGAINCEHGMQLCGRTGQLHYPRGCYYTPPKKKKEEKKEENNSWWPFPSRQDGPRMGHDEL